MLHNVQRGSTNLASTAELDLGLECIQARTLLASQGGCSNIILLSKELNQWVNETTVSGRPTLENENDIEELHFAKRGTLHSAMFNNVHCYIFVGFKLCA